ncbi:hypothetical protein [Aquipseudomonas alcaligenes]|uniref:Uncharacterized protein n=1 Tax=Aquipseudomonas alcaligenes TaxID=43263 RepID=A0AB73I3C4_AQUAC|nr:hypothetical protein [Pseudomonas alcaligenes]MDH0144697.1 hypothetical protein [Pseudomonas alcaligenes]
MQKHNGFRFRTTGVRHDGIDQSAEGTSIAARQNLVDAGQGGAEIA